MDSQTEPKVNFAGPPLFGSSDDRAHYAREVRQAAARQSKPFVVAPRCRVVSARTGKPVEPGCEVRAEDVGGSDVLHALVRRGVILAAHEDVIAANQPIPKDCKHIVCRAIATDRGTMLPGTPIYASMLDRPAQPAVEPENGYVDPHGRPVPGKPGRAGVAATDGKRHLQELIERGLVCTAEEWRARRDASAA